MTNAQFARYNEIRNAYKADPRWLEAENAFATAEYDDEREFAAQEQAFIERRYQREAEQARLAGL